MVADILNLHPWLEVGEVGYALMVAAKNMYHPLARMCSHGGIYPWLTFLARTIYQSLACIWLYMLAWWQLFLANTPG